MTLSRKVIKNGAHGGKLCEEADENKIYSCNEGQCPEKGNWLIYTVDIGYMVHVWPMKN